MYDHLPEIFFMQKKFFADPKQIVLGLLL
jgi:hypothetical protein